MSGLLLALAVPETVPSGNPSGPPPEEFMMGWLWVVTVLCMIFALYLLADSLWTWSKKHRHHKWQDEKIEPSTFLASAKSHWSSDDDGGSMA
jgi:hypothetical protein